MTSEQLRSLLKAEPFHAFSIHLADGRTVEVRHPEFLMLSPSGRTMVVSQPDDTFDIIDLLLVTRPHVGQNGKQRKTSSTR